MKTTDLSSLMEFAVTFYSDTLLFHVLMVKFSINRTPATEKGKK